MRRALSLALLACLAAAPAFAQATATDCDRLAGFAHTPRLPGLAGVWDIGDADAAIAACEHDAWAEGADPFLRFLLARAYEEADPNDARIVDLIESASGAYPVFAAHRQARLLSEGLAGVALDAPRARALNRQACDAAPDPQALAGCNNLALDLLYGVGEIQAEGAALLDRTCAQGFMLACSNLATELGEGGLLPHDPARSTALYMQACEGGLDSVCAYAAYALEIGDGVEADPARAAPIHARACAAGDVWSCLSIGLMQIEGEVIARDWSAGLANLDQACAGGVDEACYRRGMALSYGMDQTGDVTPEDQNEAFALFADLCARFHGPACTETGWMMQNGLATARDPARAAGFAARACALGDMMGCNNLGVHFGRGDGVGRNAQRAADHYRLACEAGTGLACFNLSDMLAGEDLGTPDPEGARALRAIACERGYEVACP